LIIASFVVMFIAGVIFTMSQSMVAEEKQSEGMQVAHAIGLSMYMYANDHNGKYPSGRSSTEVFQQLIDGGYISDPTLFYIPMAGKTKADGKKLKAENVCWDVTDAVNVDDSPALPLVFTTGYKIHYIAGGTALPLADTDLSGLAVYYVSNSVTFRSKQTLGIAEIDQRTFNPKGKTYRQLTPDGPLP
jgi:hypothetical protein